MAFILLNCFTFFTAHPLTSYYLLIRRASHRDQTPRELVVPPLDYYANIEPETDGLTNGSPSCSSSSVPPLVPKGFDTLAFLGFSGDQDPHLMQYFTVPNDTHVATFLKCSMRQASSDPEFPIHFLALRDDRPPEIKDEIRKQHARLAELTNGLDDRLITIFFRFVYPTYPIVNQREFIHAYKTDRSSIDVCLLSGLYAISCIWWKYDKFELCQKPIPFGFYEKLFRECRIAVERSIKYPTLGTIQGLLLLAQKNIPSTDIPSTFSSSVDISTIIAISHRLGLHIDCTNWSIPASEKLLRKRLWAVVYLVEKWNSANLGVPSLLSQENTNWDEYSEDAPHLQLFVHFCKLTNILDDVVKEFYSIKNYAARYKDYKTTISRVEMYLKKLHEWRNNLPDKLKNTDYYEPGEPSKNGILHLAEVTIAVLLLRLKIHPSCTALIDRESNLKYRRQAATTIQRVIRYTTDIDHWHLHSFWHSMANLNFCTLLSFFLLFKVTATSSKEHKEIVDVFKKWENSLKQLSKSWDSGAGLSTVKINTMYFFRKDLINIPEPADPPDPNSPYPQLTRFNTKTDETNKIMEEEERLQKLAEQQKLVEEEKRRKEQLKFIEEEKRLKDLETVKRRAEEDRLQTELVQNRDRENSLDSCSSYRSISSRTKPDPVLTPSAQPTFAATNGNDLSEHSLPLSRRSIKNKNASVDVAALQNQFPYYEKEQEFQAPPVRSQSLLSRTRPNSFKQSPLPTNQNSMFPNKPADGLAANSSQKFRTMSGSNGTGTQDSPNDFNDAANSSPVSVHSSYRFSAASAATPPVIPSNAMGNLRHRASSGASDTNNSSNSEALNYSQHFRNSNVYNNFITQSLNKQERESLAAKPEPNFDEDKAQQGARFSPIAMNGNRSPVVVSSPNLHVPSHRSSDASTHRGSFDREASPGLDSNLPSTISNLDALARNSMMGKSASTINKKVVTKNAMDRQRFSSIGSANESAIDMRADANPAKSIQGRRHFRKSSVVSDQVMSHYRKLLQFHQQKQFSHASDDNYDDETGDPDTFLGMGIKSSMPNYKETGESSTEERGTKGFSGKMFDGSSNVHSSTNSGVRNIDDDSSEFSDQELRNPLPMQLLFQQDNADSSSVYNELLNDDIMSTACDFKQTSWSGNVGPGDDCSNSSQDNNRMEASEHNVHLYYQQTHSQDAEDLMLDFHLGTHGHDKHAGQHHNHSILNETGNLDHTDSHTLDNLPHHRQTNYPEMPGFWNDITTSVNGHDSHGKSNSSNEIHVDIGQLNHMEGMGFCETDLNDMLNDDWSDDRFYQHN